MRWLSEVSALLAIVRLRPRTCVMPTWWLRSVGENTAEAQTNSRAGQLDTRLMHAALDENAMRRGILEIGRREAPVASHQILGTDRRDIPVVSGQPVDHLGPLLLVEQVARSRGLRPSQLGGRRPIPLHLILAAREAFGAEEVVGERL